MKLDTKVARLKRSIRGQTVLDEDRLKFALLAIPKDGGYRLLLEQELLIVVYMSIIITLEHN